MPLLEADAIGLPLAVRLARTAARLAVPSLSAAPDDPYTLRPDQDRVVADLRRFLLDVAARPDADATDRRPSAPPEVFGRVILPPRTGKTLVAAHLVARSGLVTTFVVPTKTLVEQTARELTARLPGVPVGVYYSERKSLVEHGINVTTYTILQRDHARGTVPAWIARAAMVVVDEAHRAMSADRMAMLRGAFAPGAVRIALTATPDYDDERVLCRHFPRLVHEVTLEEALALRLLAPCRLWVAEVDVEGSTVTLLAGDYEEGVLGRVMSAAPFARAAELFRYRGTNASMPALIACTTRQQAHDLHRWLTARRPEGTPPPALILGETPGDERRRALEAFEDGRVDTLVQVGVLLEGWSSARCKLLIDLAPTLSRVRATQKYFRVMTRDGDREARIVVLLPMNLPDTPLLPIELFGPSARSFESGALLGGEEGDGGARAPLDRAMEAPVEGVRLRQRVVLTGRLAAPRLDRARDADVRAVIATCPAFDPDAPCGLQRFRALRFEHPLFTGRGEFLMRWLGVSATVTGYASLLAWVFPDGAAARLLLEPTAGDEERWCRDDARHLLAALTADGGRDEGFAEGWRALTGVDEGARGAPDPLEVLLRKERAGTMARLALSLPSQRLRRIVGRFGLWGPALTLDELADDDLCSAGAVSVSVNAGMNKLRGRAALEGGALRVFEPVALPPSLRGVGHWREEFAAWAAESYERACRRRWTALVRSLVVRDLPSRLGPLLASRGAPGDLLTIAPDCRSWQAEGLTWVQATWEAPGVRVTLCRVGQATARCDGGECEVMRLRVEVIWPDAEARLSLDGPLGELQWCKVDGDRNGAVEKAWCALEGLPPRKRPRQWWLRAVE